MQNQKIIYVEGMSCENCRRHVQQALAALEGVESAEVDLASGRVNINLLGDGPGDAKIKSAIEEAGYQVVNAG